MILNKTRIVKKVNRALAKCGLPETAKELPIKWENLGKRKIGLATCDEQGGQLVKIDEGYFGKQWIKKAEEIYAHELIHHALADIHAMAIPNVPHVLDGQGSHGKTFIRVAHAAGLRGWGDNTWRYKWTCPQCGTWLKMHKKGSARFCNRCPAKQQQKTVTVDGVKHLATVTMRIAMKCKKLF